MAKWRRSAIPAWRNRLGNSAILAYLTVGVAVAGLTAVPFAAANANVVSFSWSPSSVGLTNNSNAGAGATDIVGANNYNIADFAAISINPTTGAFNEVGYLNITNFLNGGTTVPALGLGGGLSIPALNVNIPGYSLFLAFTAAGTTASPPTVLATSSDGTFSSLNYTLVGTPNVANFGVSGASASVSNANPTTVLGYGSLIPGTGVVTLTKTAGGLSPTANVDLTFNECSATSAICTSGNQSAFFLDPLSGLDLQVGNFSATDTVTSESGTNPIDIDIDGGGGNLTFVDHVPEPASITVIVSGILGLAYVTRRRRKT